MLIISSKKKNIKKLLLFICIGGLILVIPKLLSRPSSLDVNLNKEFIYKYESINKSDLTVEEVFFSGQRKTIDDYSLDITEEDSSYVIKVESDKVSGIIVVPYIDGKLEASYPDAVKEGEYFDISLVEMRYIYDDGRIVKPDILECDAPDVFSDDSVIKLKTNCGEAEIHVWVISANQLRIKYDGKIYQGDLYDESRLHVAVGFADGSSEEDVEHVTLNAPYYFSDKITLSVSTAYGNGELALEPVGIVSITPGDNKRFHEGDSFYSETLTIEYSDGKRINIDIDEIKGFDFYGKTLKKGVNEIAFKWHGLHLKMALEVYPANDVTDAAKSNKDELETAVASYTDDSIYVASNEYDNYFLTHIMLIEPLRQITGEFAGGIGFGYTESIKDAAQRLNWICGFPVSDLDAVPSVIIRNGELQQDGATTGNEICLTIDGILVTPEAGKTGDELLSLGVKDIWWSNEPVLIQPGNEASGVNHDLHICNILAMKKPGEYFIISTKSDGMDYNEAVDVLNGLDVTYARPISTNDSAVLMVGQSMITGTDTYVSDFMFYLS